MNMTRSQALRMIAGLALGGKAFAQSPAAFPSKPIKWIVPFPPGGAVDAIARIVSQRMTESLDQPVIVENRPGSGGMIGTDATAKAAPDGHTLVINSTGLAVEKWFYPKVPFDARKDLAPVILLANVPSVLVVRREFPAVSLEEFVALAKRSPGKFTYASAGLGTSLHLAAALFAAQAGVKLLHVPYKGSGAAASDLLSGRVDMMVDSVVAQRGNIQAGLVRPLAVTAPASIPLFPELPSIAQAAKLPGYEVLTWCGIFTTGGTPPAIVQRLNEEMNKALQSADVQKSLLAMGVKPEGGDPQRLRTLYAKEVQRWDEVIPRFKMNVE